MKHQKIIGPMGLVEMLTAWGYNFDILSLFYVHNMLEN